MATAKKKAPAKKASGSKLKFGSPEWQAKYGRGKAKTKARTKAKTKAKTKK